MKKILSFIIISLLLFSGCVTSNNKGFVAKEDRDILLNETEPLGDIINCRFEAITDYTYWDGEDGLNEENRKIFYQTDLSETPELITFSGVGTETPMIKGNNGESPLFKLLDDAQKVVLIEHSDFGDLFFWTIFKEEKVAVWNKTYKMLTIPFTMTSMGYCY